jgi:hypothetical protein
MLISTLSASLLFATVFAESSELEPERGTRTHEQKTEVEQSRATMKAERDFCKRFYFKDKQYFVKTLRARRSRVQFATIARIAIGLFEGVEVVHRVFHSEAWKCLQNHGELIAFYSKTQKRRDAKQIQTIKQSASARVFSCLRVSVSPLETGTD